MSKTSDWGVTLLRLWTGFLIGYLGFFAAKNQWVGIQLSGLLRGPDMTALSFSAALFRLAGGALFLLGIAPRLAGVLCVLGVGFVLWQSEAYIFPNFWEHLFQTTLFVSSLVLLFTGPGRLNLGSLAKKR